MYLYFCKKTLTSYTYTDIHIYIYVCIYIYNKLINEKFISKNSKLKKKLFQTSGSANTAGKSGI